MSEEIVFHFEGGIAASSQMNFYEAARFQYDASRLLVKLAQFRSSGGFVKKITDSSNKQILLKPHRPGSFDISLLAPSQDAGEPSFVELPLSTLLAYVGERVIGKAADGVLVALLNAHPAVVRRFGKIARENEVDSIVIQILSDAELRGSLPKDTVEILDRRMSELAREQAIDDHQSEIERIDDLREQRLVSMAAPLLSGMATAFRRSARTLHIVSRTRERDENIIFLNKELASEIGSSKIDPEITPIVGNVIQYNKETGWGKVRLEIVAKPLSFSVPSDMKADLQADLMTAMNKDSAYLQIRFVRDRAGEIIRGFVISVLEDPY